MDLIVQGPGLSLQVADELAGRVGADPLQVAERAYRLTGAKFDKAIGPWCESRHIDFAWLEETRHFTDLKLLAMDMDSTLITIECIDELGDLAGKKAEIAGITAQAMRGEIDYPESLRKRVGLLAGLPEDMLRRVYEERLKLTPGAEKLVAACKANGVKLLLVSGGFTYFVERLKKRLGFDYTISNELEISGGKLTGALVGALVDADAKAKKFLEVMKELNLEKSQTLAIGDGANDLKMMAEAGLSVAFRAKPVVRKQATCALNWSGLDGVLSFFA